MLDHISLRVQDLPRAVAFYRAALAPIGYRVPMEFPGAAGLGEPGKPDLWITLTDKPLAADARRVPHRPRAAWTPFTPRRWRRAAPTTVRPACAPTTTRITTPRTSLDPEGNNIEVVCHDPPGARKAAPARAASPRRPAKKVKKAARKPARRAAKPTKSTKPKKRR